MHDAMFPHPVDRYRLIQRIVRLARATYAARRDSAASDLQAVVARRATVSPTIVANLENLEKCLEEPARKPGRDRFLRVLTWGLELPRIEIEALLWLLDEPPLRPQEAKYYLGYLADAERAAPRDLTSPRLRQVVLDQIGAVLDHAAPDSGSRTTAMQIYTATASGRLAAEQRLLDLERLAGQRLRSAQLPSIVNFSASIHDDQAFVDRLLAHDTVRMDEAQRRTGRAIFQERMRAFTASLETYGGRSIIEKASLVWYLTARDEGMTRRWRRPLERRREHVAGLLHLLEYPHFQLGLVAAGDASELEINLKTTEQIVLRSADHRELWDSNPQWGPRLFACDDRLTVLQFYYDFERAWDRIPPPDRDRDRVRRQLTALLDGARAGETEGVLLAQLDTR